MSTTVLDTQGLMCPEPIIKAELAIADIAPGSTLLVLATDPAAPIDFEAWCEHKGLRYQGYTKLDKCLEILLSKNPV